MEKAKKAEKKPRGISPEDLDLLAIDASDSCISLQWRGQRLSSSCAAASTAPSAIDPR